MQLLVMMILYVSCISVIAEEPTLLQNVTYNSIIELEFDTSGIENPIPIDQEVTIPLVIKYSTDLKKDSIKLLPDRLLYNFYFGSAELPKQTLTVSVNKISNIDLKLNENEITFDIPFDNNTYEKSINLIISPTTDAIAQSYYVQMNVSCDDIFRLKGSFIEKGFIFSPEYVSCLKVSGNNAIITESSEINSTSITVENCGNDQVRITPLITSINDNLTVIICPKYLDLSKGASGLFNISVMPKEAFKGVKTINFSFTSEHFFQNSDDSSDVYDFFINCTYKDTAKDDSQINLYLIIIIIVLAVCNIFFLGKYRKYW
jgi:hypothetical protein